MDVAQIIANGLIAGSIYALVAAGFSLIYNTNRFMHFAHGSIVTVGAYALWCGFTKFNLPLFLAAIFAVAVATLAGLATYRVVYRPLVRRGASSSILLIAGLALLFFFENSIILSFGSNVKSINYFVTEKGVNLLGAAVTPLQISIVLLSVLFLILFWVLMRYSKIGITIRAVADHSELARISGINTERVQELSFILGSALAGIAAVFIVLEQNATPFMATKLVIKGFSGAVIGGITSLPGAILGSYFVGLMENFGAWFLPSGYKDAIVFGLLIIFLVIRPIGILGVTKGVRE
ncbi:MAG: branched-chain amino acid ABC transporter permease [Patescibacteria group bacterium]|jgi:branched-chain amino acid transport system permease protein